MQRLIVVSFIGAVLLLFSVSSAQAQQDEQIYQQLFGKTQEKLGQAKTAQADILSPDVFARALKRFDEAKSDFKRGRALSEINNKVREVNNELQVAMKTAEIGKVAFASVLTSRDAALQVNAPQYAPEKYSVADKYFLESARKLEGGDMNGAKKRGEEAERLFREAELHAIKVSIIGNVRAQIEKAKEMKVDRLAPTIFGKSQTLLAEAENILNSNRYAAGTAREKAEAAEYEIRHAKSLAEQIQRIKVDETQLEKQLLGYEQKITSISQELDFTPQFDEGLDKPTTDLRQAVKTLRQESRSLTDEVSKLNTRLDELNRELTNIRETQAGLESQLEKERRKLQEQKQREERLKQIEALFQVSEAKVIREGDHLRIRLTGLSFQSGKAVIRPEHFSLLTKLQRAIREFPNSSLTIEGHTDAVGDDGYNQRLSTERANAVQQYLLANMNLPAERIQAVGFGESSPVASNETDDGRSQNRRIDVVIAMPQ